MNNGARLSWLINPQDRQVEIYRQLKCGRKPPATLPCPGQQAEVLQDPANLSGEDVLPGFVLDLGRIFAIGI
jgi:Uma2 family endonuclease